MSSRANNNAVEVCILAGGLSSRMGRDKARLRLGGRTLLGLVRHTAAELGLPVRVIRRDKVPRCGPLGGVYTALSSTTAQAILFLSCDMPLVTAATLKNALKRPVPRQGTAWFFTAERGRAGFPFLLGVRGLLVVERQLAEREYSLQSLAEVLKAGRFRWPKGRTNEASNINTPEDWQRARAAFAQGQGRR